VSIKANKPLEAVENDLKRLMANVSRAMEKAQAAVVRIAAKAGGNAAETEPTGVVALESEPTSRATASIGT